MPRRTISDEEISLIKGMLSRGMKNKDIQFFFNRRDRPVNSGRITGIANGTYANAKSIAPAENHVLDQFLSKHDANGLLKKHGTADRFESERGPIHVDTLLSMFAKDQFGVWRLTSGETDQHECKKSFGFKFSGQWLKAIAALANNRGGYILFGVHDKTGSLIDGVDYSYAVIGMEDDTFKSADPEKFAKLVKSTLDPTPRVQLATIELGGKLVGVIHVEQHPSRPVIVTRPEGDRMREGDIFFRYPGQSDRIKYSDLRSILDERDIHSRQTILPMIEKLLSIGPSRALIADLAAGTLGDGKRDIVIDSRLAEQLHFIREGQFDEKDGAPTLKLVGELKQMTGDQSDGERLVLNAIREDDILRKFIQQHKVEYPEAYIRAGLDHQRKWLPIFYYVSLSGKTAEEMAELISQEKTTHPTKKKDLIARLSGKLSARGKPPTQAVKALAATIAGGRCDPPADLRQSIQFSHALMSLEVPPTEIIPLLAGLEKALDIAIEVADIGAVGTICRAICRVDELFFKTAELVKKKRDKKG